MRYCSFVVLLLCLGVVACQPDGPIAPEADFLDGPRLGVVQAATPFDFTLRESIPIPSGSVGVIAVRDMDADGALDIVLFNHSTRTMIISEKTLSGWVTRYTAYTGDLYTALRVGDVDGDGVPEIGAKASFGAWFRVYESTGDNAYALKYHQTIGYYPESVQIGDSDGNGLLEFLVARETFPSRVHRFEGTGNDTYTQLADLLGEGGDNWMAGVSDLDGDGLPETVFSDNQYYRVPDWRTRANVYVYEGGARVFYDPAAGVRTTYLGDFDGNGLGEILGVDSRNTANMKILESTGSGNDFQLVYHAPTAGYSFYGVDADGDGVTEIWRAVPGSPYAFELARRTGGSLTQLYESGDLLQAFSGGIRGMFTSEDTNGDGGDELVVVQGELVHVLELGGTLVVGLDIKPGSEENPVNTKTKGKIPVAILSTEDFAAVDEVDVGSLTFGATGDEPSLSHCGKEGEDVDDDGLLDLVCHFRMQDTGFAVGDTEGVLKGLTLDGTPIEGRDVVWISK